MKFKSLLTGVALGVFVSASFAAASAKNVQAIESAVAGSWRSADAKERDAFRHPVDALEFWGLKPGATILEIQPGGGWWTEILAPFARANKGEFYATAADLDDPKTSENARKGRASFAAKYADAAVYGKVNLVNWGANAAPLPADKFDFVMLTRGFHGWMNGGSVDKNLANVFQATKPGGVLAIEQHRAKPDQPPSVFNGYVPEKTVIDAVEKAGFKLDGKSEINANPKDTKDYPKGVWTLPPNFREGETDKAKYAAIGESDRFTLKFVKPAPQ